MYHSNLLPNFYYLIGVMFMLWNVYVFCSTSREIFLFLSREATAKDEVGMLSNLFSIWKYNVNASSELVRIST